MLWEYRLLFQYWLFHCAMTEWWYSATWFITMFSAQALLVSVCLWNFFHPTLSAWEGEEGDFSFDGLPGAQHEFKVEVPGNQEECFVQKVAENAELHASFEVRFRYKNMHKRNCEMELLRLNNTLYTWFCSKLFSLVHEMLPIYGFLIHVLVNVNTLSRYSILSIQIFIILSDFISNVCFIMFLHWEKWYATTYVTIAFKDTTMNVIYNNYSHVYLKKLQGDEIAKII